MSQNDFSIASQTAYDARLDINSALQALASNSSEVSEPATRYANMFWYDTTNHTLKMRNEANSVWISLGYLDQSTNLFKAQNVDANINTHLNTGTATASQNLSWTGSDYDWVDATPAQSTAHLAIGTYHHLAFLDTPALAVGATVAGSSLRYSTTVAASMLVSFTTNTTGLVSCTGTWRHMGGNAIQVASDRGTNTYGTALFVRIE
jgi:hypothetical protein